MKCDLCYELYVKPCQSSYTIQTGLGDGETVYTMVLQDIHGHYYTEVQLPNNGAFTIHTDMYPDGMFNEYSGSYEVYFTVSYLGGIEGDHETMTIDGNDYECLLIKVKDVTVVYD